MHFIKTREVQTLKIMVGFIVQRTFNLQKNRKIRFHTIQPPNSDRSDNLFRNIHTQAPHLEKLTLTALLQEFGEEKSVKSSFRDDIKQGKLQS